MANTIFTFSVTDMSYPSVSFMLYTATSSSAPSESVVTIDWGDGSTAETETISWSTQSSSKASTFSHSYASIGTYNVEVTCASGTIGIPYAGGEGPSIYGDLVSLTTGDGLVNIDSASLGWQGYEDLYVDNITIGPAVTSICNPFTTSRINEVIIDGGQDLVIDISESLISDTNIKSVTIGGYISEIPNECFWWVADLTDVTFGDNVASIGSRAFYDVADLTDIYFCNSTPPTFESDSFDLSDNTITFHVPIGSLSAYTDAIDALSLAFTYTIEEWDPHPVPPTPPTPTPTYPESYINNRRMQEVINEVRTRLALKQDIMQVTEMPTPSQYELGYAYLYMGATDANFTHGVTYECVSNGQSTPTYSWQALTLDLVSLESRLTAIETALNITPNT